MRRLLAVVLVALSVAALLAPAGSLSAQSNTFTVPGALATSCSIGSNPEGFAFNVTYTWPGGPLALTATVTDPGNTGLYGSASASLPAGSGSGVPGFTFPTTATLPVPYPWAFTVRVVGSLNGVPTWQADVRISCPAAIGPYTATQLSNGPVAAPAAAAPVFEGPGLPAGSDLRVVVNDVGVTFAPDGDQTGKVIAACKTVFVTAVSNDGLYGQVFVMGGWIPLASTIDVAEDYGQPGGQAVYPPCAER